MRTGRIGIVVIAALALAACEQKKPAPVAKPAESVAERPAPAQQVQQPPVAAAAPASVTSASWVARAGEVAADESEFVAYARIHWTEGLKGRSLDERRELARRLMMRKAAAADAEKRGLANDPAVANADMKWRFETYPPLYWAQTVEKEVRITDQELRAHLKPQAEYLLSAIVVGDDHMAEQRAREVQAKLAAGGDFEEIAREQSEGFLAAKGGDMGWVTVPNFMVEAKEAAVIAKTRPGADTEPLRTRLGWTIFRVRERKDADKVFAAMKQEQLPGLLQGRLEEAKAKRVQELRKRASIHYPADMPNAPKNAPAAVVNGYAFPADPLEWSTEPHGGVPQSVTPPRVQLERTIDTLLVVLEAERIGIGARPDVAQTRALKRMDVLAQLQFRGEGESVTVTDKELREEYKRYYTPDAYEFQIIVAGSRERAAEALRRLGAGESFDALAGEMNTGMLAASKGLVPLGSPSVHPASVQAALPALKDGEVSGVLDLGGGSWGVIKRKSQQFFVPPPFEQVSGQVRKRLEFQKRADRTLALAEEYNKKLVITYNESLLAKL